MTSRSAVLRFSLVIPLVTFCTSSLVKPTALSPQDSCSEKRDDWVRDTLMKMESIRLGMTREELMKVFRTEGGFSTGLRRTFVSRECPYFKVDVQFRAVGRPDRDSDGRVTSVIFEGSKECRGRRVVTKGLAEVGEAIDVPWAKNEGAAELKRIFPEFVLTMPCRARAIAALEIVAPKYVKHISDSQVGKIVSLALFVNEQGEVDSRLFLENTRIVAIAEANCCEGSAFVEKSLLVLAQLRDMLAAKNSSIVAKKNDDCWLAFPQRSEANFLAKSVGKNNVCESLAKSFQYHGS